MRTVRTDILSEIRRSHRPDAGPVHSERTAGKGSHTAGNRSSAEDHCRANRDWLGEPVKLGVRKKIRLVAVDLPKGTSYRRKPRSGGRTPRLTLRRPSGIPPRMISPSPAPRGLRDGSLGFLLVCSADFTMTEQQATQTIPIVFAQVSDPVGGGFVKSLARPGGNVTGFALYEYAMGVKWLELLNQIAPRVNRAAVIYDPDNRSNLGQLPEIENRAPSFGMRLSGGLIVLPNPVTVTHRKLIIAQAAKRRLPAVYAYRFYVTSGGLASYGVHIFDLYRRAASYVDRILKSENPGELSVQYADKFELVINLKTPKALNLDPPNSLLARTDGVIE